MSGRAAELAATVREALENTIRSVDGYTGPDVWWKAQVEAAMAAVRELEALAAENGFWEDRYKQEHKTRHAMEDTIAGLRGQLADEMGLTEQQRARAEAAEAENTRLRAALEQIKQELGHVTQTPAQAAAAALAIARDALAASPNEDA